jgi:hypothetical protein
LYCEVIIKPGTINKDRFIIILEKAILKTDKKGKLLRMFKIEDIAGVSMLAGGKKPEMVVHHKLERDWRFYANKTKQNKGCTEITDWL